jgi:hypothetical protein
MKLDEIFGLLFMDQIKSADLSFASVQANPNNAQPSCRSV